ncbi:Synaptojanin-1 [Pseudocercospora fuligena]|uniref:Synaptojanin-1 n=1 Tax=Pseudocercospora fuligena TaxID=685502 RepID=A0A8H6VCB1_9PEZI|nr:Synaptojanin-1 [Pseudocercospora fuligena]
MPDKLSSRPNSVATSTSSLMQDVPGAFPPTPQPQPHHDDQYDSQDEDQEVTFKSLSQAVYARRAEYVRAKQVRIKIGSWNVAACKGTEKDVSGWFVGGKGIADQLTGAPLEDRKPSLDTVEEQETKYERKQETLPAGDTSVLPGGDDVGLYVLALQEIIDITAVTPAIMPHDPSAGNKWKEAMETALPKGYTLVAEQQLIGLLLLIYASPAVAHEIKSVSTTSVGTGLLGYMGNKGAVTARLVLGETTRLVFVNSHLAAGADKSALERRNWDAQQIISRTRFEPIQDAMDLQQTTGETIGDEDFCFWCGDLNYRLEGVPGDDIRRLLMLHTRKEYDVSHPAARKVENEIHEATESVKHRLSLDDSSSSYSRADTLVDDLAAGDDPSSLQATINSLLPHDELHQQMKARKAFHDGWREGPITFLPTYKYDVGSVGVFDSSEKKRAPSWCDRILFRTRKDKLAFDDKIRQEEDAKKKDAEMEAHGIDQGANEESILYDYDPETDGADAGDYDEYDDFVEQGELAAVTTREGFEDEITLEYYTGHQRVLSSDHKPLDAGFILKYDAVVPDLKAKVHAEVAKELDKAENEGRPNVTVVVDKVESVTPMASDTSLPGGKSDEGVSFGDVRWAQSKHRSLTVANTSRVASTFSFIERPVDSTQVAGIAPRWLEISINDVPIPNKQSSSEAFTLEPGDTAHVMLELKIKDMDGVSNLNYKSEIEDILVLRVENGRDHFIPIRARWLESSLTRTIDTLCRIPEGGIRKLQGQMPKHPKEKAKQAANAVKAANVFGDALERTKSGDSTSSATSENNPPVRFSAPRELFRLTEAIEELSTRIVAEWEMLHDAPPTTPTSPMSPSVRSSMESRARSSADVPKAPWDEYAAWPFDEQAWNERKASHWDDALSLACNALDEDVTIENALPDDLPRIQRLYVLCDLLLIFLRNMPDGVVTAELWARIEAYLGDSEKSKRGPTNDEQRTAIQEILSESASHNISFTLITAMLERMIQEVSGVGKAENEPPALPMSPGKRALGSLRRIAASKGKAAQSSQKELASKALARVFAAPLIRALEVGSEKTRSAQERRKIDVVEIFLKRDEPG